MYLRWLIYCCVAPIQGTASVTVCPLLYYLLQKATRNAHKMHTGKGPLRFLPFIPIRCFERLLACHVGGAEFILRMYTSQEQALNGKSPILRDYLLGLKPFVHRSVMIPAIMTWKFL